MNWCDELVAEDPMPVAGEALMPATNVRAIGNRASAAVTMADGGAVRSHRGPGVGPHAMVVNVRSGSCAAALVGTILAVGPLDSQGARLSLRSGVQAPPNWAESRAGRLP